MNEVGQGIRDADIVYADITGNNPNVFYELGVAHTLHKSTIVVKQLKSEHKLELPADLRGYKVIGYPEKEKRKEDFAEQFGNELEKVINRSPSEEYGNPVFEATLIPSPESIESILSYIIVPALHPFTAIFIETGADGKMRDARVKAVSTEANKLFGYEPISKELHDKRLTDLGLAEQ